MAHALGILQNTARAQRDAGQRIVGDGDWQAGFVAQNLIQIGQQRTAAGQYNALVHDIGGQLRRRSASSATFTASTIAPTGSAGASAIWRWVIGDLLGHAVQQVAAS